jgi:hypothetical protein
MIGCESMNGQHNMLLFAFGKFARFSSVPFVHSFKSDFMDFAIVNESLG